MTRVRRPLMALIALFTLAITLDRLGADHGSDVIASPVYALAALVATAPLAMPGVRRSHPGRFWAVAIGLYAVAIAFTGWDRLATGPIFATEVAFLVVAARLGHHLASSLDALEDTLGAIAFGEAAVRDIESPDAADQILDELSRSRRHDRPLSLTVIAPTAEGMAAAAEAATVEIDRAVRHRYVQGRLARAVGSRLRRTDLLFEHRASGRLFVVSPETDTDGSDLLRKRLGEAATAVGIPAATGVACFPGDAIGFDTLVEMAETDLAAHLTPVPRLRAVEQGIGA